MCGQTGQLWACSAKSCNLGINGPQSTSFWRTPLECKVPDVVAEIVTNEIPVPTIGMGAGVNCDGQVLVFYDVTCLGAGEYLPKFVNQYAQLADDAVAALEEFFADVESGVFPSDAEAYHMPAESEEIVRKLSGTSDHLMADKAMER